MSASFRSIKYLGHPITLYRWGLRPRLRPQRHLDVLWSEAKRATPGLAGLEVLLEDGDSAIDVGANSGIFTNWMARAVGARGSVVCIEPNPLHLAGLQRLERRLPQLHVHQVGASDRRDELILHVPVDIDGHEQHWAATFEGAGQETRRVAVEVRRLDDLAPRRPVALIKCDVEGHEDAVLSGAADVLLDLPALFIEVEQRHRVAPVTDTFDGLRERGYIGYMLTLSGLRPIDDFDVERDQLRHLEGVPRSGVPGPEYVHDFLFVGSDGPDKLGLN